MPSGHCGLAFIDRDLVWLFYLGFHFMPRLRRAGCLVWDCMCRSNRLDITLNYSHKGCLKKDRWLIVSSTIQPILLKNLFQLRVQEL